MSVRGIATVGVAVGVLAIAIAFFGWWEDMSMRDIAIAFVAVGALAIAIAFGLWIARHTQRGMESLVERVRHAFCVASRRTGLDLVEAPASAGPLAFPSLRGRIGDYAVEVSVDMRDEVLTRTAVVVRAPSGVHWTPQTRFERKAPTAMSARAVAALERLRERRVRIDIEIDRLRCTAGGRGTDASGFVIIVPEDLEALSSDLLEVVAALPGRA